MRLRLTSLLPRKLEVSPLRITSSRAGMPSDEPGCTPVRPLDPPRALTAQVPDDRLAGVQTVAGDTGRRAD
jgi:hypothetical protein